MTKGARRKARRAAHRHEVRVRKAEWAQVVRAFYSPPVLVVPTIEEHEHAR